MEIPCKYLIYNVRISVYFSDLWGTTHVIQVDPMFFFLIGYCMMFEIAQMALS